MVPAVKYYSDKKMSLKQNKVYNIIITLALANCRVRSLGKGFLRYVVYFDNISLTYTLDKFN